MNDTDATLSTSKFSKRPRIQNEFQTSEAPQEMKYTDATLSASKTNDVTKGK